MSEGELIAGRYRIERRIGGGGMGVVWQARDSLLDRTVAVKRLHAPPRQVSEAEAENSRQRAFREARIAARFQHANAITVYDVVDDAGRPALVMEYLPSRSLAEVLAERGTLAPAEVARIGGQLAGALAAAHRAGVVHRDIKPANVLLAEDGTAKITDFGISRAAGDVTLTQTGLVAGTPAYLSPEAARGEEPDAASDVFSFGATLYAAVEGQGPFGKTDNENGLLYRAAIAAVIPSTKAGPLTPVLTRMLRERAADRPSMADLGPELAALTRRTPAPATVIAPTPPPRTTVQPAVAPAGASAAPPPAVPAGHAGHGSQGNQPSGKGRRGNLTGLLVGLVVVALVAVVVLAIQLSNRDGDTAAPTPSGTPSAPATSSPSSKPPSTTDKSTPAPSTPESTSSSPTPASSSAQVPADNATAVSAYYAVMPGDTDAGWARLGPSLQAQGRDRYDRFWSGISSVKVVGAPAASGGNTVDATLEFVTNAGKTSRERHRFTMVSKDGKALIDVDQVL